MGTPLGHPFSKRVILVGDVKIIELAPICRVRVPMMGSMQVVARINHIMLDLMGNCEHFFHASLPYLDQHDSQYLPNLRLDGHWNLGWIG